MINLKKAQKELTKLLVKQLGLDFEFGLGEDRLTAKNSVSIDGYDDDVFISFVVFKSGSYGVDFVFDKIDRTPQALELLQNFNENSVWLAAFIRDDGYLVLRYNVMQLSDDDVVQNTESVMQKLISPEIREVLTPLTRLTYSKK